MAAPRVRALSILLASSSLLLTSTVVGSPSATAYTTAPSLQQPVSGATYALSADINLIYGMNSPAEGTGRLVITPLDACASLGSTEMKVIVGPSVSYFVSAADLDSGRFVDQYVLSGPTTLSENCQYSFTLSYQNDIRDPAASTTNTPITIDSGTATPTLDTPASSSSQQGSSIPVAFTLPDAPLADSIQLTVAPVTSACGGTASVLGLSGTSVRGLTLNPANLADAAEILQSTGPNAIRAGCRYDLTVSYQDFRGSPRSAATNTNILIGTATDVSVPTPTPTATPALRIGESKKLKALLKTAGKPLSKRMRIAKFAIATPAQCRVQRRGFIVTGVGAGTCRGLVVERPKRGRGKVKRVRISLLVS